MCLFEKRINSRIIVLNTVFSRVSNSCSFLIYRVSHFCAIKLIFFLGFCLKPKWKFHNLSANRKQHRKAKNTSFSYMWWFRTRKKVTHTLHYYPIKLLIRIDTKDFVNFFLVSFFQPPSFRFSHRTFVAFSIWNQK